MSDAPDRDLADPLRALDTLDRFGFRVRWVTDLGEEALLLRSTRLLLVDTTVSRDRAEAVLLDALDGDT